MSLVKLMKEVSDLNHAWILPSGSRRARTPARPEQVGMAAIPGNRIVYFTGTDSKRGGVYAMGVVLRTTDDGARIWYGDGPNDYAIRDDVKVIRNSHEERDIREVCELNAGRIHFEDIQSRMGWCGSAPGEHYIQQDTEKGDGDAWHCGGRKKKRGADPLASPRERKRAGVSPRTPTRAVATGPADAPLAAAGAHRDDAIPPVEATFAVSTILRCDAEEAQARLTAAHATLAQEARGAGRDPAFLGSPTAGLFHHNCARDVLRGQGLQMVRVPADRLKALHGEGTFYVYGKLNTDGFAPGPTTANPFRKWTLRACRTAKFYGLERTGSEDDHHVVVVTNGRVHCVHLTDEQQGKPFQLPADRTLPLTKGVNGQLRLDGASKLAYLADIAHVFQVVGRRPRRARPPAPTPVGSGPKGASGEVLRFDVTYEAIAPAHVDAGRKAAIADFYNAHPSYAANAFRWQTDVYAGGGGGIDTVAVLTGSCAGRMEQCAMLTVPVTGALLLDDAGQPRPCVQIADVVCAQGGTSSYRMLIDAAERFALRWGFTALFAVIDRMSIASVATYERMGFTTCSIGALSARSAKPAGTLNLDHESLEAQGFVAAVKYIEPCATTAPPGAVEKAAPPQDDAAGKLRAVTDALSAARAEASITEHRLKQAQSEATLREHDLRARLEAADEARREAEAASAALRREADQSLKQAQSEAARRERDLRAQLEAAAEARREAEAASAALQREADRSLKQAQSEAARRERDLCAQLEAAAEARREAQANSAALQREADTARTEKMRADPRLREVAQRIAADSSVKIYTQHRDKDTPPNAPSGCYSKWSHGTDRWYWYQGDTKSFNYPLRAAPPGGRGRTDRSRDPRPGAIQP